MHLLQTFKSVNIFSAHILFDDSMEQNDREEFVPNGFVKMFLNVVNEAARSVYIVHLTLP